MKSETKKVVAIGEELITELKTANAYFLCSRHLQVVKSLIIFDSTRCATWYGRNVCYKMSGEPQDSLRQQRENWKLETPNSNKRETGHDSIR
jgi:hypothetical protein